MNQRHTCLQERAMPAKIKTDLKAVSLTLTPTQLDSEFGLI
jgi:hypothetical protein